MKKKLLILKGSIKWLTIYLCIASLGFILGMIYQQVIFTQEIAKVLSYSDIDLTLNFNETKLVEGFKDNLNQFVQKLNQTSYNNKQPKENETVFLIYCFNSTLVINNSSIYCEYPKEKEKN